MQRIDMLLPEKTVAPLCNHHPKIWRENYGCQIKGRTRVKDLWNVARAAVLTSPYGGLDTWRNTASGSKRGRSKGWGSLMKAVIFTDNQAMVASINSAKNNGCPEENKGYKIE